MLLAENISTRYSKLESAVDALNESLKKEELNRLIAYEFLDCSELEIKERTGGLSMEEYFENELIELDVYTLESHGAEFSEGQSFEVIKDPSGDAVYSFVLDGYAGEGTFKCCYKASDAPDVALS